MARGKNAAKKDAAKKDGTANPSGEVDRGVGSQAVVGSSRLRTPLTTGQAGGGAGPPALGIAVMSPWGWRLLAVFTMLALGLCMTFFLDAKPLFGALWLLVTAAWGGFSYMLWRRHLAWDQERTSA